MECEASQRAVDCCRACAAPTGIDPIGDACDGRIKGWITDKCWAEQVAPLMDEHEGALPGEEKRLVKDKIRELVKRLHKFIPFS